MVANHRNDVAERVAAKLAHHKLAVADLNAELDKMDRKRAMDGIRSGTIRIVIASDLAARGLNIPGDPLPLSAAAVTEPTTADAL